MTLLAVLALGFVLGMRHATDADHVVAVTTIISRERSRRSALAIGALWGLGHTATILLVGGAIIGFGLVIPPRLGLALEMSVAVMLVVLGVMNLTGALRHLDQVAHASLAATRRPSLLRPLVIGVVHGLAGSAAIALLVLATIREPVRALAYLVIFGAGTVVGMMLLTTAMTLPLAALARRFGPRAALLSRLTGVLSIGFGLVLAYQIGIVDGLLGGTPIWSPR